MNDLIYSARTLGKNAGFSLVAVITLALGVGANTAIFSVVKTVLLDRLPYHDPERLVTVAESDPGESKPITVGFTTAYDWRRLSKSFEAMSLYRDGAGALAENGEPELLRGLRVNYDFFETLGIKPQLGRSFLQEEDHPKTRREIILSHGLWTRRFGSDPNILGRTIRLSEAPFRVVGVLPASFQMFLPDSTTEPEMFMPLGYDLADPSACRDCQHLRLVGRLKPGVTVATARAELDGIQRNLNREFPASYPATATVAVGFLRDRLVGKVSTPLWVLFGAVGFVLLIACANVANLMLARATSRGREMAVRAALGAKRSRLIRQLLTESVFLSLAGGAAGILLALWAMAALAKLAPHAIPRAAGIHLDAPVMFFALVCSLLTGVLFGLAPAWRASSVDLNDALKGAGKRTEGRSAHGLRAALIVAEIALAFVLVAGAGLLGNSLVRLLNVNPGYDPHNVFTLQTYVYSQRYQKAEVELGYYDQVMSRLRAIPGIESTAMVSTLPLGSFDRRAFHIHDRHLQHDSEAPSADAYSVSPEYFAVMKIPLKRGRLFSRDDRANSPGVALISESCAGSQFPNQDPIGKQIQLGGRDDKKPWLTIVGIVGDVRQYGFDKQSSMEAYIAQAQDVSFGYTLVARTTVDPRSLESAVRAAFLAVDPTQPVFNIQPMEDYVAASMVERTFSLTMLALFGLLALILASVGIYGVTAYSVATRTREVGVRMALGADKTDILSLVLRQSMVLVAIGLPLGFLASVALTRLLASLLFEVRPADLPTSIAVALILAGVALLASYIPARRAEPTVALRYE